MVSSWVSKLDNAIKWSFYILFFLVPLVMWPDTFELFEFNKMWFVFGMSILIAFLWGSKMISQKRLEIRRTPLDIPLLLFLVSQIISTIFSMEPHTSFWGYYSRFNGGLLSTISYIFLYYAFASNLISADSERKPISYSLLTISLLSGLAVTLWGLPSHFGADPTCLVFRGTLDISCWTDQFQPTVRIFSTLGQPNWMGTFIAALIPITIGFGMFKLREQKPWLIVSCYLSVVFLFFLALLYTRSQSSFLGLSVGLLVFYGIIVARNLKSIKTRFGKSDLSRFIIASILILALTSFFVRTPIESLNKFTTLSGLQKIINRSTASIKPPNTNPQTPTPGGIEGTNNIQIGGSESSDIRLIVWQGAIELFKRNPIFGTGVETFAYAYYQVKPVKHNLTSEWDFLYNKAHNEYLNYLATSGAFGLLTYLLIIASFIYYVIKQTLKKDSEYFPIALGIFSGFIAITVSNFFGFSVVVVNLYFFIFPILFLDLVGHGSIKKVFAIPNNLTEHAPAALTPPQTILIVVLGITALYYEFYLLNFWSADRKYALGNNLDKVSEYVQAYTPLAEAVKLLPNEDLYKDELSINMATLSLLLAEQKQTTQAAQFGQEARLLSDAIIAAHPNNVVYLKTRARVAFALSEIDPNGIDLAIATIEQARKLAPTDAKLVYNEGLFYEQQGKRERAISYINEAIKLKPNYIDAYYSLALLYADEAKKGSSADREKARELLNYILKNIDPTHKATLELLKSL